MERPGLVGVAAEPSRVGVSAGPGRVGVSAEFGGEGTVAGLGGEGTVAGLGGEGTVAELGGEGTVAGLGGGGTAAELGLADTSAGPRGAGAPAVFGDLFGDSAMPVGRTDASAGRGCGPGGVAVDARRPVLLVPVPSGRAAVRARGHDPARRIALAAAGELRRSGVPARVLAVLRQRRAVADQSGLNSRQRLENLAGALTVAPGGEGLLRAGRVVLVDDLMTTGASLTEAARAVRAAMADRTDRTEGEVTTAVYTAAAREGMGEPFAGPADQGVGRRRAVPGKTGAGGAHDVICAAVVAASPDSFEINRN
nr:hypothetical protein [Streptomyces cylindrosporus]